MGYSEYWNQIFEKNEELNSLISSYWRSYSSMGTWQFWVVVALLVLPLILLYFTVDRKRIFEVLFFGYTVHVLWTYTDIVLESYGYFIHKHFLTPLLPYALNMTASVLPVSFLLLYQYSTNKNKNFYLLTLLLSAFFVFILAPIERFSGLSEFRNGMNYFYLYLIDLVIVFITYWLTRIILKLKEI